MSGPPFHPPERPELAVAPDAPFAPGQAWTPPGAQQRPGESVLGDRTVFDGTIRAAEPLRIQGTVQGEIASEATVYVEEAAQVNATVSAQALAVAGRVRGDIRCRGRLEVAPTGRVAGEIRAGTLVMQEGALLDGTLHMGGAHVDVSSHPA